MKCGKITQTYGSCTRLSDQSLVGRGGLRALYGRACWTRTLCSEVAREPCTSFGMLQRYLLIHYAFAKHGHHSSVKATWTLNSSIDHMLHVSLSYPCTLR